MRPKSKATGLERPARRQPHLTHGKAVALMVLVALLWSMAGVVTRQLESARAFEVTFWRSAFTALSLAIILPVWQGPQAWRPLRRGGWAIWLSGACWAVMFTAFMVALTLTSVANVLITLAAGPLLTAVVSRWVTGHQLPTRTWWAIGVAGLGIGWMFASQLSNEGWMGFVVAFCVPIGGAVNWTLAQQAKSLLHSSAETAPNLVPAVAIGAWLSSAITLPMALPFQASAHDLGLLAVLGLFQLAIPCVLAVVCARALSAPELSLLALLEVLFGTCLAWWGAGEQPSPTTVWGGSLVVAALAANEGVAWWQLKQTHLPFDRCGVA